MCCSLASDRTDSRPGPERPHVFPSSTGASVIEMHAWLVHQPKEDERHVGLSRRHGRSKV